MMIKRPYIANQHAELGVGAVLVVVGFALLWDAWDGRGRPAPKLLKPLLPW